MTVKLAATETLLLLAEKVNRVIYADQLQGNCLSQYLGCHHTA